MLQMVEWLLDSLCMSKGDYFEWDKIVWKVVVFWRNNAMLIKPHI